MTSGSVPFDRAAAYYDRTRPISPRALPRVLDLLEGELGGRGRCLEVGVGTGALALPLVERGVPMAGLDLSRPMLGRLVAKAGGTAPLPLVEGDATSLPFQDRSFGGVLMRHVLHLIGEWRRAVDEAVRVTRPGGVVVVGHGWYPSPWRDLFEVFVREARVERPWVGLGHDEPDLLHERMAARGAPMRALDPVREEVEEPLRSFVDGIREGVYSWTWGVEEGARAQAAERVAAWAEEELGPLDEPGRREEEITFWAYDVP